MLTGIYKFYCAPFLVDCILSPWSSCSETCGQGTQKRSISISPRNGGKECTGDLNRACTLRNCPSNQNPGDYDSFAANVCNLPENLGYSGMLSINFKALFLLTYVHFSYVKKEKPFWSNREVELYRTLIVR